MKSENFTIKEIEFKLKQYCSYQDRCHSEVENKLSKFNLINEDYLNETRFCKSFVRGKFKIKNWGKRRIIQELKSRKISEFNIKKGLSEINEFDYQEKFENLFNKKLSSLENLNSIDKKRKIFSYLQYRGWETNLIYEKINQIL